MSQVPDLLKTITIGQGAPLYSNGFPAKFVTDNKLKDRYGLRVPGKQLAIDSFDKECGPSTLCPVEVREVIPDVREVETYDIEVADNHEFFCDGYLTHNSALISLSNPSDRRMQTAKHGEFWKLEPQRCLANNSSAWTERPDVGQFMLEWHALYESKSGERGIFNRQACQTHIKRMCPLRDSTEDYFVNPCAEILLLADELCNLSEVVIRAEDTPYTIKEKVRKATIVGTWQSSLTDFKFVAPTWAENCKRERLLGVSLTGIMDNRFMSGQYAGGSRKRRSDGGPAAGCCSSHDPFADFDLPSFLCELRMLAIETNRIWAARLGIGQSAAITTIKPSGTVSQLVDASSGIHPRHSRFYVRTVRSDTKNPITTFMKDVGIPWEPDITNPDNIVVFSFPIKAPDGCITRADMTALQHLEICRIYNTYWCQHNCSVTISVRESEWMSTGAWVYDHFNEVRGMSFLPYSEAVYLQAPYQECTEAEYTRREAAMPKNINWVGLQAYEKSDTTVNYKELACSAGQCELV